MPIRRLAVLALALALPSVTAAAALPNIVFLFADDQRADTVAAYGKGSREPLRHERPLLFDLDKDPGERYDVATRHPGAIESIRELVAEHERRLVKGECELTK